MLLGSAAVFAGCAETSDEPADSVTESSTEADTTNESETETTVVDDRFTGVDFGGRQFRIHTSTNIACTGMGNSNFLIEGPENVTGVTVSDTALERNLIVERTLNVDLTFYQSDLQYTDVDDEVRTLITSGTDDFDLIINDLFPFATLTIEGQFRNVLDEDSVLDFDQSYWYDDYMADLRLMDGYQYLLAGDYFIDVLRSAHLLLLNKEIYNDYHQADPDGLYDTVTNFEWTYDKMNTLISSVYEDNGAAGKSKGDVFGFITPEYWGGSIAYTISGNPNFIERDPDTGEPTVVLGADERARLLSTAMTTIFNNDNSSVALTAETELLTAFVDNECLILDYQRLGSLENVILRDMKGDACVLPYPMLMESDRKYTTSTHDTTEVGAILSTVPAANMEFITTVIEVLNRETANILMPEYYKEGLQVQYVDDPKAAAMIDIIHDNFDNSFALAYNNVLGQMMLEPFYTCMADNREFAAVYNRNDIKIGRKLSDKMEDFIKHNVK